MIKYEREILQLFVGYAAIATSSWRFWKYNIDTPIAELSQKHWEMVNISNAASATRGANESLALFALKG